MTPDKCHSPQKAFRLAASKDDIPGMRCILSSCPEHMSPITPIDLFTAFNDALRDNRMKTAEFLLSETRLKETMTEEMLSAQVRLHGRSISLSKER